MFLFLSVSFPKSSSLNKKPTPTKKVAMKTSDFFIFYSSSISPSAIFLIKNVNLLLTSSLKYAKYGWCTLTRSNNNEVKKEFFVESEAGKVGYIS